jgi:hypothetical protein
MLGKPPRFFGLESSESLLRRLEYLRFITDDNMAREWNSNDSLALIRTYARKCTCKRPARD